MTDHTSLPRRNFLRGQFLNALKSEQVKQQGQSVIRPPWADLANFAAKCTACNQCVLACETQILQQGANGYPEVNFSLGKKECSFCQACVKACEAGVFRPTDEPPWTHKVAIQAGCLTKFSVECRSCEDSCEVRAIRFQRKVGGVAEPVVNLESCNGCGACLSACPVQAIQIVATPEVAAEIKNQREK